MDDLATVHALTLSPHLSDLQKDKPYLILNLILSIGECPYDISTQLNSVS